MTRPFLCLGLLVLGACASDDGVQETTSVNGVTTSTATVRQNKDGSWQTESGDAAVVVGGNLATESQLPYGGGKEGVREAEDSAPPEGFGD